MQISSTLQRQREKVAVRVIVYTLRRWIKWKAEHREQFEEFMRMRNQWPPPLHPLPSFNKSDCDTAPASSEPQDTYVEQPAAAGAGPSDPLIVRADGGPQASADVAANGGY